VPIAPGTLLGPYEIQALLGAGGMGEVYKARDTRLDRIVAIKVLPAHLADNPDLRERFEREAKTIASLNHPHICTLYDVGRQDGIDFLVMEYLEGETLSTRLLKGPLPLDQVLRYAIEISDALDKAHRKGVTHRDLKPGNLMLIPQSGSKLLDFGLAKLKQEAAPAATPLSQLPTLSQNPTVQGTILGTLQYMAPEQVEGKTDEIDPRTDVFSFGVLLYEMATGKKAFEGKSTASLFAKILEQDPPPISSLQPMTPPALDRIVKRCLAKEPDERWQSAGDLTHELKWIAEGGSQTAIQVPIAARRKLRDRIAWPASALLFLVTVALAIVYFRERPPEQSVTRLFVLPQNNVTLASPPVISPDGRKLAFVGRDASSQSMLWIRLMDALAAQPLPGTNGADRSAFWSPDSRFLAFFAEGKLKKLDIFGGPPVVLCDTPNLAGGTWNKDGVILFGRATRSGLSRVAAAGGSATPLTTPDPSHQETGHRAPYFLPDGDHFLFHVSSDRADRTGIYLGSLNSREKQFLFAASSNAQYAPPGYVLFLREGTLMAQPFDAGELQLSGQAFPIAEQVAEFDSPLAGFSASENGALAYASGGASLTHFVWVDRAGRETKVASEPGQFAGHFALSPDEKRVAQGRTGDIWLLDLTRGTNSRFTFDPANDANAIWSPDGNRLVFASNRGGKLALYTSTGGGQDELLAPLPSLVNPGIGPTDWSSDGRFILSQDFGDKTKFDLSVIPLSGDRKPVPFLQSEFDEGQARFSPDGRWVAYTSTESGPPEVYVQSFPASGGKWQVSTGGGILPLWRGDGKELFYVVSSAGRVMSVEVKTAPQFEASAPKLLFTGAVALNHAMSAGNHYAVSADGQRFLLPRPVQQSAPSPITVVLNWTAALPK